jgi:2-C-methyl-D-erythritol 4-phosphate cytidylyltransferase
VDRYAIIVAGGKGTRMKSKLAKQFIEVRGTPIIVYTIRKFQSLLSDNNILVVLADDLIEEWRIVAEKFDLGKIKTVVGGEKRFNSVYNGLKKIDLNIENKLVAIHDAVRPFVSKEVISDSFNCAEKYGSAITTVKLKDSLRMVSEDSSAAVDREKYRIVQTPQTFNLAKIINAFKQAKHNDFTDDAAVYENFIGKVDLIEGNYENIKITTPEDLLFAESYITKNPDEFGII